jgi:hypothetical protein
MKELEEKMLKAISGSHSNSDAARKCKQIAKDYTLKVLDNISQFKDKDGDRVYINIIKTRMSVELNES